MDEFNLLYLLLVALVIGLLIGVERGWQERASQEGTRIAGVRTYGLIGLLGGALALLSQRYGGLVLALGFVGLAAILTFFFMAKQRQSGDWGITSLIAALLAYVLAALAASGQVEIAVAATVLTVLILSYKAVLHEWLRQLGAEELRAGIKLLLISVVLLPVLPDTSWGPWEIINPYRIWWMVVVIALISFLGYFAIKMGGLRRGVLFMAFFGGLASSTAVTLHLSRVGKAHRENSSIIASAILIACSTMFFRMLLVISLLKISLLPALLVPILMMAMVTILPVVFYWKSGKQVREAGTLLKNPLELKAALGFGAILVVVMLLSEVLRGQFGDKGLISLAAASGIADVDAIVLSLIGMVSVGKLTTEIFVIACVVAAAMNSLCKAGISYAIGGAAIGIRVLPPLIGSFVVALLFAWTGIIK